MILVLDASAAAEIVLQRRHAPELMQRVEDAETVLAPDLFVCEVANVFWKYQALAGMDAARCAASVKEAVSLPDVFVPAAELIAEAFDVACRTRHPVYDVLYLVLARRHAAVLATLDRRLAGLCRKSGVRCR